MHGVEISHKLNQAEKNRIQSILDEEEQNLSGSSNINSSIALLDEQCRKIWPNWEPYSARNSMSRRSIPIKDSYSGSYQYSSQKSPSRSVSSIKTPTQQKQSLTPSSPKSDSSDLRKSLPSYNLNNFNDVPINNSGSKTPPSLPTVPPLAKPNAFSTSVNVNLDNIDAANLLNDIDNLYARIQTLSTASQIKKSPEGDIPIYQSPAENNIYHADIKPLLNNFDQLSTRSSNRDTSYASSVPRTPIYINNDPGLLPRRATFDVQDSSLKKSGDYKPVTSPKQDYNISNTPTVPKSSAYHIPVTPLQPRYYGDSMTTTNNTSNDELLKLRKENWLLKSETMKLEKRIQIELAENKKLEDALEKSSKLIQRYRQSH